MLSNARSRLREKQIFLEEQIFKKMRTVTRAYSTKRECSFQEAVSQVMPGLWLV